MITDSTIDTTLRSLDTGSTELTSEQAAHKDALLATIVATGPNSTITPIGRARHNRMIRWAAPVAAAVALGVSITYVAGPQSHQTAYASWTSIPQAAPSAVTTPAAQACLKSASNNQAHDQQQHPIGPNPDTFRTTITETRGKYTYVLLTTPDNGFQQCLLRTADPNTVVGSTGSWLSDPLPPPKPTQIHQYAGGMTSGDEGTYNYSSGRVGATVTKVVVHSAGATIIATVSHGYYAAWWPTNKAGQTDPDETYDLTLTDGTVLTGQHSA